MRTLNIGVIGSGGRGINCFGKLLAKRDDARLAAVADSNAVRMESAARMLENDFSAGRFAAYTDIEAMLRGETLDAVIVTTPDYLHAAHAVAVLRAGVRFVLVDKPLATTVEGCLSITRAMRESGGQVVVGFNMRHLPLIARIKEIIANGDIGALMLIENREFYDGGRTYMARWNRHYSLSGGLWVHKGSHDFDVFNWWNEGGDPLRVSASAGLNALRADKIPFAVEPDIPVGPNCSSCAYKDICPDYSAPMGGGKLFNAETSAADGYVQDTCVYLSQKDTHDNGIALVEYSNNVRASHMECFVCNFTDRFYTVVGERGTVMAHLANPTQIELRPRWGEDKIIAVPPADEADAHGGADPLLLDNFLSGIKASQAAGASASSHFSSTVRDGIRAVAVGQAAEIAWREGRTVAIEELLDWRDAALNPSRSAVRCLN
jgi:predicted dehydrogenase